MWLGRRDNPPVEVIEALEPWREVLRTRAGFIANPERRWWETHRTRDKEKLRQPKVIALYRTDRGRFALDEDGAWQPSNKTTIVTPGEQGLSVAYVCGLLNSELLDLWYAVRGKTPWHVRRNYEPKPMNEMPYRHVSAPDRWVPSDHVHTLARAAATADLQTVSAEARALLSAVGSQAGDADAAAAIEHLVRAVTANRRALLPLRSVAPELRRAVKNPWRTHGVEVGRAAVLAELPATAIRSVRLDPELAVNITTDGVLGHPHVEDGALVFTHSRRVTARVDGSHDRVALLQDLLGTARLMPDDLLSARMPASLSGFGEEIARRQGEIDDLLTVGRELVEVVERLVCALYGVPDALTDLVVESAVTRAGTVAQQEE